MKILYLIESEIDKEKPSSILKKAIRQSKVWMRKGCDVYLFSFKSGVCVHLNKEINYTVGKKYSDTDSAFKKLSVMNVNAYCIYEFSKNQVFDFVYSRVLFFTPFLERLVKKYKTVFEINSYDVGEYKQSSYSIFTRCYNFLFGKRIKKYASGFVFVTQELKSIYNEYLCPSIVLANGYDYTNDVDFCLKVNNKPTLVFVVSPGQPWQGVDRLLVIAEQLPRYTFKIIGEEGNDTENLTFMGYLSGDSLSEVLKEADFGIGTLALDRKSMHEACPLKSREYLDFGLPCFGNYYDTDLNDVDLEPIYMRLSDSANIHTSAQEITDFVDYWLAVKSYKKKVRIKAKSILDDSIKEEKRLRFFLDVVKGTE